MIDFSKTVPQTPPANPTGGNFLVDSLKKMNPEQLAQIAKLFTPAAPPATPAAAPNPLPAVAPPTPAPPTPPANSAPDFAKVIDQAQGNVTQAQTGYTQALDALKAFQYPDIKQVQYEQPQPSKPKGLEIGTTIAALLAAALRIPGAAPLAIGAASGVQGARAADDKRRAEEAGRRYQADIANQRALIASANARETNLTKNVDVSQRFLQTATAAQEKAVHDQATNAVAQQNAQTKKDQAAEAIVRDKNIAAYRADNIKLGHDRISATIYDSAQRNATTLQAAGIRSSTAVGIANQRSRIQLIALQATEAGKNARSEYQGEIRMATGQLTNLTNRFDSLMRQANMPGVDPAVKAQLLGQAQAIMAPKNGQYETAVQKLQTLGTGIQIPHFAAEDIIEKAGAEGYEQGLSSAQAGIPLQGSSPQFNVTVNGSQGGGTGGNAAEPTVAPNPNATDLYDKYGLKRPGGAAAATTTHPAQQPAAKPSANAEHPLSPDEIGTAKEYAAAHGNDWNAVKSWIKSKIPTLTDAELDKHHGEIIQAPKPAPPDQAQQNLIRSQVPSGHAGSVPPLDLGAVGSAISKAVRLPAAQQAVAEMMKLPAEQRAAFIAHQPMGMQAYLRTQLSEQGDIQSALGRGGSQVPARPSEAATTRQPEPVAKRHIPGTPTSTRGEIIEPKRENTVRHGDSDSIPNVISEASQDTGVPERLLAAVIAQESGFNPRAQSKVGAKGLMQLMDGTAKELGVSDPYDVRQNIGAGAMYLRQMLDRFHGNVAHALAAYNAGPNGNFENPETQNYVRSILGMIGQ
jgi:hypothetical protein